MDPELRKRWQANVDEHFSMQYPSSLSTRPRSPSALASFKPSSWYREARECVQEVEDWQDDEPFQLLEKIGQGGMGVVFRARQRSLGRGVAIKKLHQQRGSQARIDRSLFEAEAHTMGRLDHPNIVPIYELGESTHGDPFLAMKLVGGRSWRELLWEQPKNLERHLEILLQVCNAVAFAHSRRIVHNDLKPSNVMIGDFGEVLLMNWGLAVSFGPAPTGSNRIRHVSDISGPCARELANQFISDPNNYNAAIQRVSSVSAIVGIKHDLGLPDEALASVRDNVAFLRKALEIHSNDKELLLALSWNLRLLGRSLPKNAFDEAQEVCTAAVEIAQAVVHDDALNLRANNTLGLAFADLGVVLSQSGFHANAKELYREAIALYKRQLVLSPGITRFNFSLRSLSTISGCPNWQQGTRANHTGHIEKLSTSARPCLAKTKASWNTEVSLRSH